MAVLNHTVIARHRMVSNTSFLQRGGPQHSPCVLPDPQGQSTSLALSGVRVFIFAKTSSSLGGGAPNPLVVRAIPFFFLLPPLAASAVVGLAPTAALGLLVMMLNPVVNPSRVRKRIVDIACIMRATFTSIMFVALQSLGDGCCIVCCF